MGGEVLFRKGVVDEIVRRADAVADEVCGLLLGEPDRVTGVLHCCNVAPDPAVAFEISPRQLIAALRDERAGGPRVVGCYHSHPTSGAPTPSPRDAIEAAPNGWLWLITAGRSVGVYRAVERGRFHGRFDTIGWLTNG